MINHADFHTLYDSGTCIFTQVYTSLSKDSILALYQVVLTQRAFLYIPYSKKKTKKPIILGNELMKVQYAL